MERSNELLELPVKFKKPPFRFLGFTLCRHVWKKYWLQVDESVSVETEKCARCQKDKPIKGLNV
jgi:hypothetical protein